MKMLRVEFAKKHKTFLESFPYYKDNLQYCTVKFKNGKTLHDVKVYDKSYFLIKEIDSEVESIAYQFGKYLNEEDINTTKS